MKRMSKGLCSKVKTNPYAYEIVDRTIGLKLDLVEDRVNILIFRKRYDNQAGYIFVVCDDIIDEEKFKKFYKSYSEFVKEVAGGIFKEVELVLVANEIDANVKQIIDKYNESYVERKPIRYMLTME